MDTYTLQVFYRGFEPHESGPSRAPIYRDLTWEKVQEIKAEFDAKTEVVVLDYKCWVNKRVHL